MSDLFGNPAPTPGQGSPLTIGGQAGRQSQSGSQSGTANQQNVYSGQQQGLQGTALSTVGDVLQGGQLPGNFENDQAAYNAMNSNFQRNIAPMMAAQFGAGSSAIGSQYALMNEQLAGQLSQQAYNNFSNVFNDAANFAFTPEGSNSQESQSQNQSGNQASANATSDLGGLITDIFGGGSGF